MYPLRRQCVYTGITSTTQTVSVDGTAISKQEASPKLYLFKESVLANTAVGDCAAPAP